MDASDIIAASGLLVSIVATVYAALAHRNANAANAAKIILAENAARLDERVKTLERERNEQRRL